MYLVTKTYGHECGLSAIFRQWRAESHCRFLHGYALSVRIVFACDDHMRDENGWVQDFGGLKPFKQWLEATFDHKHLVAKDDPAMALFLDMSKKQALGRPQLTQIVVVDGVGCEAFARMIYKQASTMLVAGELDRGNSKGSMRNVRVMEVEVREHGGNSATYIPGVFDVDAV